MRTASDVTLRGELGYVAATAWAGGRVLALIRAYQPGELTVYAIDPSTRRVVGRRELAGTVLGGARLHGSLVLLLGPRRGLGTTRLVTVDGRLRIRAVALHGISGGYAPGVQSKPGLALDARGRRVFVVDDADRVAVVGLVGMTVAYRGFDRETQARAKTLEGPIRSAEWLGGGLLAVSGWRYAGIDPLTRRFVQEPAGLTVVDTRSWSARTIDAQAGSFAVAARTLVVTPDAGSVRAYDQSGAMLFEAFPGKRVEGLSHVAGRLFVRPSGASATTILDGRSGRVLGVRPGALPFLLQGSAATIY